MVERRSETADLAYEHGGQRPPLNEDISSCFAIPYKVKKEHRLEDEREDLTIYWIVINHEERRLIWPEHREIPLGWQDADKMGTKAKCLAYIEDVWTDMQPAQFAKKDGRDGQTGAGTTRRGVASNDVLLARNLFS